MKRLTTTADRLAARWIPTGYTQIFSHADNSAIYGSADGRYGVVYKGTAYNGKHYDFVNIERRNRYVATFGAGIDAKAAVKAERKAAKAAWVNPLKAGDVLYSSWGWEQTNVDFYVVTKVSGKKVTIAQIAASYEASSDMTGRKTAILPVQIIGPEMVKMARGNGFDASATIQLSSYSIAQLDTPGKAHGVSSYA